MVFKEIVMNVLSVIHYPFYGGPQNRNTRISKVLKDMDVNMHVLLPEGEGNAYEIMKQKGVDVSRMPLHRLRATKSLKTHISLIRNFWKEIRAIRKLIDEKNIDVVMVNGLVNPHGIIAAYLSDKPSVWQILDTRTPKILCYIMMGLARLLKPNIMSTGLKVAYMHPFAKYFDDNKKLFLFFPPVDTKLFAPNEDIRLKSRSDFGLKDEQLLVATVGNLTPQKGHENFIRAAAEYVKMNPDKNVRFMIFGNVMDTQMEYFKFLKNEIRDHKLDNVFTIQIPDRPVNEILPALDMFVQASVPSSEGIPTAILEAISCGLPVVSSDVGSISEVVKSGENGLIVPVLDSVSMAKAFNELIQDLPLRRKMSEIARAVAVEKYDVVSCAKSHKHVFECSIREYS